MICTQLIMEKFDKDLSVFRIHYSIWKMSLYLGKNILLK